MMNIGRVCIKNSGRDKNQICVVIDNIDERNVLIDGNVRRKKCNVAHLNPLDQTITIEKNESSASIKKELSALGHKIIEKGKIREPKTKDSQKKSAKSMEPKKESKPKKEVKKEKPKETVKVKKETKK
jgi:large subunit ribosomal protein L14e